MCFVQCTVALIRTTLTLIIHGGQNALQHQNVKQTMIAFWENSDNSNSWSLELLGNVNFNLTVRPNVLDGVHIV